MQYLTNNISACRGSAMVEFSLLLSVVLPVGFGMAMLGKLADIKQTTEQASRYAAWEATVYSRDQLAQQPAMVETRFFSSPEALISSHSSTTQENGSNPLWGASETTSTGLRALAEVVRDENSLASTSYRFDTGKAKTAARTGKIVAAAGKLLDGLDGNSWGLVADGMLQSTVDIAIRPTGLLRATQGPCGFSSGSGPAASENDPDGGGERVCIKSSGVILADGWAASNDQQAVSRIRSLVPGSGLQSVGKGVGKLLGSIVFPELDALDKAFGHVDMRVLPRYTRQ